MAKQTLKEWIQEVQSDGDPLLGGQQDAPLSAIALVHMVGGGGVGGMQKEIYTVKMTGQKAWTAHDLAQIMQKKAENYCQDAPGVQYFSLLASYGGDQPKAEHPFLVNVKTDEGGFFSEGPDAKGEKQQSMRHLEMSQQQVYAQQQHLNNFLGRTVQTMSAERHAMMQEVKDMTEIMKEMMLERITNQHEARMKEMEFQRGSEMRSKLLKMVPPLANTITGRNIFPQETADTALVELIADNVTQEDLQKMGAVFGNKPELLGALMSRMQAHLQRKREAEEERAKLLPAGGNPEDDAAGGG
jgi:hypothetical protein